MTFWGRLQLLCLGRFYYLLVSLCNTAAWHVSMPPWEALGTLGSHCMYARRKSILLLLLSGDCKSEKIIPTFGGMAVYIQQSIGVSET